MKTEPNSIETAESKDHVLNVMLLAIARASPNPQKIVDDLNKECERLSQLTTNGHHQEFVAKPAIKALQKLVKELSASIS